MQKKILRKTPNYFSPIFLLQFQSRGGLRFYLSPQVQIQAS